MPNIRPITDLRNHFSEISKQIHASPEPIILTKNGYGDMVVMSLEAFEAMALRARVDAALKVAEIEARETDVRYDFHEVMRNLKERYVDKI
jgi:prevent-host-death family protein